MLLIYILWASSIGFGFGFKTIKCKVEDCGRSPYN